MIFCQSSLINTITIMALYYFNEGKVLLKTVHDKCHILMLMTHCCTTIEMVQVFYTVMASFYVSIKHKTCHMIFLQRETQYIYKMQNKRYIIINKEIHHLQNKRGLRYGERRGGLEEGRGRKKN